MSDPVWPASLPQYFELDSYRESLGQGVIETPTDTGPGITRKRFTKVWRPIEGVIRMTAAQASAFETFYVTTLKHGTLQFSWVHPITQAAATFRFRKGAPRLSLVETDQITAQLSLWLIT